MTGERALVTGASGFIGAHLTAALTSGGTEVHALGRESDRFRRFTAEHPEVHCHTAPDEPDRLRSLVAGIAPAACFHLATYFVAVHGPADVEPLVQSNLLFPSLLADALAEVGTPVLVNVGTAWQNRGGAAYSPNGLYAATKQAFEDILAFYAESERLAVCHLKLFDTYGPGDTRRKLLRLLLDARSSGARLAMSPGHQLIDLLHVADVVDALLHTRRAAAPGPARHFAASSGHPVTIRELVDVCEAATGGPVDVEWGATPYRGLEMFEPWSVGPPPPGWRPQVGLEAGIRQLWLETGGA